MNDYDNRRESLDKLAQRAALGKYLHEVSRARRKKAINDASIDQVRLARLNIIAAVIIGIVSIVATIIIGIVFSR